MECFEEQKLGVFGLRDAFSYEMKTLSYLSSDWANSARTIQPPDPRITQYAWKSADTVRTIYDSAWKAS